MGKLGLVKVASGQVGYGDEGGIYSERPDDDDEEGDANLYYG